MELNIFVFKQTIGVNILRDGPGLIREILSHKTISITTFLGTSYAVFLLYRIHKKF
jgi:hypothetical protein